MNFLIARPLIEDLIVIILFLGVISFHEFSHALAAYLLGDDTAKRFGRLTLNPIAHIDVIGLLCLFFLELGGHVRCLLISGILGIRNSMAC